MKQISFSTLSLNVRGLRDKFKRKKLFNWFKDIRTDIILLQETYSSIEIEEQWKLDWGGENVIFSHGSNHSKGCLILVNNNVDFKLIKEETGNDGRLIISQVEINGEGYCLVNIYAPNSAKDR